MGRLIFCLLFMSFVVGFTNLTQAQTKDEILRALKDKSAKTRGLSPTRSFKPKSRSRSLLDNVATRKMVVESKKARAEVAKAVQTVKAPMINIRITFAYNSAKIKGGSFGALNALGVALSDPDLAQSRLLLNGHTDAAGGEDYNQALSERRAKSVKNYLRETFHIAPERLIAIGFGEEQLANHSDPLAAENRRVEVVNLGNQ